MIWRWLVNSLAVAAATYFVPGIVVSAEGTQERVITVALVALILGAVNTVVRPIVHAFTGCLVVITFGLFVLVINAAMLLLTSWLAAQFGLGWSVDGFWPALWGGLVISVISMLLGASPWEREGR